jgi:hypothetical protein
LKLVNLATTITNEAHLQAINSSLEDLRKSEKEQRDRLFVIQVAKKYDWEAANKMARRKAGEYDDPELSKVLEEREKKEEKAKKEKARLAITLKSKRGGRFFGSASSFRAGFSGYGLAPMVMSPHFSQDFGAPRRGAGYFRGRSSGYTFGRRPERDEQRCHTCNQTGHFWKMCPNKK